MHDCRKWQGVAGIEFCVIGEEGRYGSESKEAYCRSVRLAAVFDNRVILYPCRVILIRFRNCFWFMREGRWFLMFKPIGAVVLDLVPRNFLDLYVQTSNP